MVTVSEIANAKWYLDPFKRLFYGKTHDSPAPFNLNSDNPNHVTTFPFYDSEYVEELGNYNEVELRGPQTLSDNITETFSGDGVRQVWRIGVFLNSSGTISEPLNVEPDRLFIDAIDPSLPSRVVIEKNIGTDTNQVWEPVTVELDLHGESGDVTWNPGLRRIEWRDPPLTLTNAWRIHGRRNMPLIVTIPDQAAIARAGRIFKHTIHDQNIRTEAMAYEKGMALLRENGDKERLNCVIDEAGLTTGQTILVTCPRYEMVERPLKIHGMNISLQGGDVEQIRLTLGTGSHTLAHMMYALRRGRETPADEQDASTTQIAVLTYKFKLRHSVTIRTVDPYSFLRGVDETPVFSVGLPVDEDDDINLDRVYELLDDGDLPLGDIFPASSLYARGSYSVAVENFSAIRV